jgi:hypothetical protein
MMPAPAAATATVFHQRPRRLQQIGRSDRGVKSVPTACHYSGTASPGLVNRNGTKVVPCSGRSRRSVSCLARRSGSLPVGRLLPPSAHHRAALADPGGNRDRHGQGPCPLRHIDLGRRRALLASTAGVIGRIGGASQLVRIASRVPGGRVAVVDPGDGRVDVGNESVAKLGRHSRPRTPRSWPGRSLTAGVHGFGRIWRKGG